MYKPYYGLYSYENFINYENYKRYEKQDNEEINPYVILNISPLASLQECKFAYMKLATCPLRGIRRNACLAYDIICNKDKYYKIGDKYKVKKKDCFYYTLVGDLHSLKSLT